MVGSEVCLTDGVVNMGKIGCSRTRLGLSRHLGTAMRCIIIR